MKRVIAALNMSRRIHDFIFQAEFIATCLKSDPTYAGGAPAIQALSAHVAALEQAAKNVPTRAPGAVQARDAALLRVRADLQGLCNFVQHLAEASPDSGAAIVANAGMDLKNATGPVKSGFVVKQGRVSGTVRLIARAEGTKASYDWQCSLDGETWQDFESTVQARQDVRGLLPAKRYLFRYRTLTKAGAGDWSKDVALLVA